MKVKAIITGSTGMVGEGVLHECLNHPDIESVLVINRRSCNVHHAKLKEIIHQDFSDFSSIENELSGYNAAFLCMGVSSFGMREDKYTHLTYDFTMALARPLSTLNSDMTACYISGAGTDSSQKGRIMWARVKGKTENDLLKLPFKQAYMFRPGFIRPTKGLKNAYLFYKIVNPLFPVFRVLFPKYVTTLKEIGLAMIHTVNKGYDKQILEVRDIVKLANIVD
ncbi:MAG: NAD-dependent epimerase/dehydratase family protein [Candidatus Marinimicrobia bacterium]|nr:NAD-dependent epimerase/dehydratase family protein [Candidatus Neomarinimicrobiota bacterium]